MKYLQVSKENDLSVIHVEGVSARTEFCKDGFTKLCITGDEAVFTWKHLEGTGRFSMPLEHLYDIIPLFLCINQEHNFMGELEVFPHSESLIKF